MDTVVIRKLRELERYIQQLRKLQDYSYEEIENDLEKVWAIERGLQISIQIIIDVGNHILASVDVNHVEDYSDVLEKLGERGVLPTQFAGEIRGMAGFRNILVHQYAEIDLKRVYDILQNRLDDFVRYVKYVQAYLSSKS